MTEIKLGAFAPKHTGFSAKAQRGQFRKGGKDAAPMVAIRVNLLNSQGTKQPSRQKLRSFSGSLSNHSALRTPNSTFLMSLYLAILWAKNVD
jgi:hypothetical protein